MELLPPDPPEVAAVQPSPTEKEQQHAALWEMAADQLSGEQREQLCALLVEYDALFVKSSDDLGLSSTLSTRGITHQLASRLAEYHYSQEDRGRENAEGDA